ncbi:hypothetical protein Mapa_015392 [Marchantia paleacea]|nr:hypothetical protein Mapa_015392 [Marchantia paleacea]
MLNQPQSFTDSWHLHRLTLQCLTPRNIIEISTTCETHRTVDRLKNRLKSPDLEGMGTRTVKQFRVIGLQEALLPFSLVYTPSTIDFGRQ